MLTYFGAATLRKAERRYTCEQQFATYGIGLEEHSPRGMRTADIDAPEQNISIIKYKPN